MMIVTMSKNTIEPWKEIGRNRAYDHFIKVDEVKYELPNGNPATYDIHVTKPAVATLAITPDNKVIVTKQFRPGPNAVLLELPGGYIDEGEDPIKAGLRELQEETGYTGDAEFVTNCFDAAASTMNRSCVVVRNCIKVSDQSLDAEEDIKVELLTLDEFRLLLQSGQMTDVEIGYLGLDYLNLL